MSEPGYSGIEPLSTHERQVLAIALGMMYANSADGQTRLDVLYLSIRLGVQTLVMIAIGAYARSAATGEPTTVFADHSAE